MPALKDRIEAVISTAAADLGYMIYECSVFTGRKSIKISVKIDNLATVSHADCERYSRRLSEKLDNDGIEGYSIEVSSPGINRKIRSIEEFARFSGAPVKIVYEESSVKKVIKGIIKEVTGNMITVSEEKNEITIDCATVTGAQLDY